MALYNEWLHSKPLSSYGVGLATSWTSEDDDTESETEQTFRSFECRRKKAFPPRSKTRAAYPAAPVAIPVRTHDFGWCDRVDARAQREDACPCGNDCEHFFNDDAPTELATSWSRELAPQSEELSEDFIFDMEM